MEKQNKIRKSFDHILSDFQPNSNYTEKWTDLGNGRKVLKRYSVKLPENERIKFPFIVNLMFSKILNYPVLPRFEKVAWEIPILYKNEAFVLAHRKFGFDISATEEADKLKKLAVEAISQINKAIPLVEALINPIVKAQVQKGHLTIESKFTEINNRYIFFRNKLQETESSELIELKQKTKSFDWQNFNSTDEALIAYNEIERLSNSKSYYLYSMVDSYFSLLEHISVLVPPFLSHLKISEMNVEEFMRKNWKQKLQTILNHKKNPEANQKIQILEEIKEQIRNPIAHGHFVKNGRSFFVHMKGLGAIPFTLTESVSKYRFEYSQMDFLSFELVRKHFDDFDEFLERTNTKFAMKYIKHDLPVAFDKNSSTEYRRRMKTENSTDNYIKATIQQLENSRNMDW